jgi:hypothetical protein
VAIKNNTTFGGNNVATKNYFISGGYFHKSRQKFLGRRRYFWTIFGSFFLATKNITFLFSPVSS